MFLLTITVPETADACTCDPRYRFLPPADVDLLFEGQVVARYPATLHDGDSHLRGWDYEFRVTRHWKGPLREKQRVFSMWGGCGMSFARNTIHLVSASGAEHPSAWRCSGVDTTKLGQPSHRLTPALLPLHAPKEGETDWGWPMRPPNLPVDSCRRSFVDDHDVRHAVLLLIGAVLFGGQVLSRHARRVGASG